MNEQIQQNFAPHENEPEFDFYSPKDIIMFMNTSQNEEEWKRNLAKVQEFHGGELPEFPNNYVVVNAINRVRQKWIKS